MKRSRITTGLLGAVLSAGLLIAPVAAADDGSSNSNSGSMSQDGPSSTASQTPTPTPTPPRSCGPCAPPPTATPRERPPRRPPGTRVAECDPALKRV